MNIKKFLNMEGVKMNNKEKALLTYSEIKRRKEDESIKELKDRDAKEKLANEYDITRSFKLRYARQWRSK